MSKDDGTAIEDEVRDQIDLERFTGANVRQANEAFTRLWSRRTRALKGFLRSIRSDELSLEAQDDILQSAAARIWANRLTFENKGPLAWRGYCRRVTACSCSDYFRKAPPRPEKPIDQIAEQAGEAFEYLVIVAQEGETLYEMADRFWLGSQQFSYAELTRRTLAGLSFYADGVPWQDVLDAVNCQPHRKPITRSELDRWLACPSTLCSVAYHDLYLTNAQLTVELLGIPWGSSDLDRFLQGVIQLPHTAQRWTPEEARAIIWRYHRSALMEEILSMAQITLSRDQLQTLFARCGDSFPFKLRMESLCQRFKDALGEDQAEALKQPGLWKRLAFQYRIKEGLPHKDILDRLSSAAASVGFSLKDTTLNQWLSHKDLYKDLAGYCKETDIGLDS